MDSMLLQTPEQLREHLKALRKQRGMTQAELATRLGIKQSRYAIIESKPEAISVRQLLDILAILGVDVLMRPRGAATASTRRPARREDW